MSPATSVFSSILTRKGPTTKAIQEVLRAIGEATSGTKDVLQTRLLTKVVQKKMPVFTEQDRKRETRILSIDMGIRNLAYCVAEVKKSALVNSAADMSIKSWQRLDLSEAFREYSHSDDQKDFLEEGALPSQEEEAIFTPERLSHMAYWFLDGLITQHQPDVVLIERQRWRSASSPTIQQWTLRVNSLEAIMWGVLTTLKRERTLEKTKFDGWIRAVDPKRVGHFWLDDIKATMTTTQKGGKSKSRSKSRSVDVDDEEKELVEGEVETVKKLSRGKAEKKAKIELLRSWLDSDTPSTVSSVARKNDPTLEFHPAINFSFSPVHGADTTRQAFLHATDSTAKRSRKPASSEIITKKVDDVTDCFLQAAAWVAWDMNLTSLGPQIDELQETLETRLEEKSPGSQLWLLDAVNKIQAASKKDAEEEKAAKAARKGKRTSKAGTAKSLGEDGAKPAEGDSG